MYPSAPFAATCVLRHRTFVPFATNMCAHMSEWMSIEEVKRLLARVDIFESLSPRELGDLASGCDLHRLEAREKMFVSPEAHARRMIVLLTGRAQVAEVGPRGRRLTVSVAEAATMVGVAGLCPRPRGMRVEALMSSYFCFVSREHFEGLVRGNPDVGLRLLGILGERITVLEERLADLAYKQVPARLASTLVRLVEGEGVVTPEGHRRIPTRYTHQHLASMIGANREAVTKAMRVLRDAGIVEVRKGHIHVADLEALERAAEEG